MAKKPFLAWDGFEYRDVQDENGIDLELLRHNLSLTVEERIEEHRRSLESVLWLQDAIKSNRPPKNHRSA
jgi:hypothetical protein